MIIPSDAIIAVEKVRDYLLKPREKKDKSKYLALAGYSRAKYQRLIDDLRDLLPAEAKLQNQTRFGDRFILRCQLRGPNGTILPVCTIWENHNILGWKFITLYPDKEKR